MKIQVGFNISTKLCDLMGKKETLVYMGCVDNNKPVGRDNAHPPCLVSWVSGYVTLKSRVVTRVVLREQENCKSFPRKSPFHKKHFPAFARNQNVKRAFLSINLCVL